MHDSAMRWILALSLALLGGACASAPEAEPPVAVFGLAEVAGRPLPVSYPEEQGCSEELLSARLALRGDGGWEMTLSKREVCGEEVERDEDVEEGTYTADGRSYSFQGPRSEPSPGEIEIESLVEGTLDGEVLTARLQDGTTVVFRRMREP